MGIKRQQVTTARRPVEVDFFDPVDVRNVGYESDDALFSSMQNLFSVRERWMKRSVDPTPVEIEICYLRNELQQRSIRKSAHLEYQAKFSDYGFSRPVQDVVASHVN